jgi:hypothetical protein
MNVAKIAIAILFFFAATPAQVQESPICGNSRGGESCSGEALAFWICKKLLLPSITDPKPNDMGCIGWPFDVEPSTKVEVCHYSVPMRDGFVLRGYKFSGRGVSSERSNGFVLLGQGNARLAEDVLDELEDLTQSGLDGYVFDYRGYGRNSHGKSRVGIIFKDFFDVIVHLNSQGYSHRTVYGVSMGGAAALYALSVGAEIDILILDSVTSCIEMLECPLKFEPLFNVRKTDTRVSFIGGGKDSTEYSRIAEAIRLIGGDVYIVDEFRHGFQDVDINVRFCRLKFVRGLLVGEKTELPFDCIVRHKKVNKR